MNDTIILILFGSSLFNRDPFTKSDGTDLHEMYRCVKTYKYTDTVCYNNTI